MQHGDHRHGALLDLLKDAVKGAGAEQRRRRIDLDNGRKINASGKVIALAVDHDSTNALRQLCEQTIDAFRHRAVYGVSFFSA